MRRKKASPKRRKSQFFVVRDHAKAIKLYNDRASAIAAAEEAAKVSDDGVRVFVGRIIAEGQVKTVKEFQWASP